MKIYWTKKSIPELSDLPPAFRRKNYKDARHALLKHVEYWIAVSILFIWAFFCQEVLEFLFSEYKSPLVDKCSTLFSIFSGLFVYEQFVIYGMRKRYRHLLLRGRGNANESDSERLIREADEREYHRWRYFRISVFVFLVIIVLYLFLYL
ncbi:TPA: hypothetical protein LVM22_001158 [Klebsiella oxytoca]|nr:hypothetical protein [Klebsiella oxytoca]